ncbi:MAG TPA: 30S ribosomal protein S2 [Oligoflexia bacterium]|nr:30S ribosomal protein S2 [Oligoflexia bacterium]HMR24951.1 30S ribosomal protein S2 [Oligoflexia bacterium]
MSLSVKALLEAGAHYGHQTRRWNPKMKDYIFGARNGIYIINLEKTATQWKQARKAILDTVANGKHVIFVGTKPQAQEIIQEEATRAGQYFVNRRWLGGMLTNFETIKTRIKRMDEIQEIQASKTQVLSKKDRVDLDKEYQKLEKSLSGIREMKKTPGLMFVVDPKKEHIAIKEANNLNIPVIAITDTNCDPAGIDYVVPSNDDALKSIRIFLEDAANACLEGSKNLEKNIQSSSAKKTEASTNTDVKKETTPVEPLKASAPAKQEPTKEAAADKKEPAKKASAKKTTAKKTTKKTTAKKTTKKDGE